MQRPIVQTILRERGVIILRDRTSASARRTSALTRTPDFRGTKSSHADRSELMALMAQPAFNEPRGRPPGQMLGINNPASYATLSKPMALVSELNLAHNVVMPTSFARSASPGVEQRTAGGNSPAELLEDPHSLLPRFTRVR